jgi:hypothetical protein
MGQDRPGWLTLRHDRAFPAVTTSRYAVNADFPRQTEPPPALPLPGQRGARFISQICLTWAYRLKRVFEIDIIQCPHCSRRLRIIADVTDPHVIGKIQSHPYAGFPQRVARAIEG